VKHGGSDISWRSLVRVRQGKWFPTLIINEKYEKIVKWTIPRIHCGDLLHSGMIEKLCRAPSQTKDGLQHAKELTSALTPRESAGASYGRSAG